MGVRTDGRTDAGRLVSPFFFPHWQRTVTHNPCVRCLAGPSVSTTTVVSTHTSEQMLFSSLTLAVLLRLQLQVISDHANVGAEDLVITWGAYHEHALTSTFAPGPLLEAIRASPLAICNVCFSLHLLRPAQSKPLVPLHRVNVAFCTAVEHEVATAAALGSKARRPSTLRLSSIAAAHGNKARRPNTHRHSRRQGGPPRPQGGEPTTAPQLNTSPMPVKLPRNAPPRWAHHRRPQVAPGCRRRAPTRPNGCLANGKAGSGRLRGAGSPTTTAAREDNGHLAMNICHRVAD